MSKEYRKSKSLDSRKLTRFLAEEGQLLLPMIDLIYLSESKSVEAAGNSRGRQVFSCSNSG